MWKKGEYDEEGVERRRTVSNNLHTLQFRENAHTAIFYVFSK